MKNSKELNIEKYLNEEYTLSDVKLNVPIQIKIEDSDTEEDGEGYRIDDPLWPIDENVSIPTMILAGLMKIKGMKFYQLHFIKEFLI